MNTEIKTDPKKATFEARREFNADISLVWRAWTEPELRVQWWAPAPWRCESKLMDFREGGRWIYEMVGPEGERHGGIELYDKIKVKDYYTGKDAFTNEKGEINENMPISTLKNTFIPTENGTLVICFTQYPDAGSLETVIKMGMSEGLNMAFDQLEDVLQKVKDGKLVM
ncbi:MAG: SRPBCC domain-containing protein [Cyclobacteriaceae bacterium]|nr:SRPBCC domain-containing protein [Cyclobacteriaceae bacterium]